MSAKIGEAHLKSRLDYAQEILALLGEYDSKTVIVAVKKDVKRFERMLGDIYEEEQKLDHMTDRGGI